MRVLSIGCALALVVCSLARAEDKAKITHLDATAGNAGDHQIVYVANADSANTTMGTALIVLKKAGKQEVAYGLYMDGATDKVDTVDAKLVAAKAKEDDPKVSITTVDVGEEHYKKAAEIIKKYADKEEHLDSPADIAMNCAGEVLSACGMKPSYRSALRPPNPVEWFTDIPKNNRKLIVE